MKENDFVKVRKMSKTHEWNTVFGVLFTGLSGELVSIINHTHSNSKSYFVRFASKQNMYDNILVMFNEKELKLMAGYPLCKNISEPKNRTVKGLAE